MKRPCKIAPTIDSMHSTSCYGLTPSLQKALIALAPKCENLHTSFIFVITTDRNANFLYTMYTIHSKKTMPELKKWSKFPLDGAF